MLKSKIEIINGNPCIFVEDKPTTAIAYTTYFEERSRYEDFIKAGYRIFFVNVSFTVLPINPETLFTPFYVGVFDDPSVDDYSGFEDAVRKILKACPDAIIFPRIYISMPQWWIDSHPNDVAMTKNGDLREIMFSDAFRKDGSALLIKLIKHIKEADYANRVGGWMLCGSSTQEWIYRNYQGDIAKGTQELYGRWIKGNYGEDSASVPNIEEFKYDGRKCQDSENAKRYSRFCNLGMAKTLDIFANTVKRETDFSQVVGTFYGYTFETHSAMFGSQALYSILDSKNLDFFSSPNAYLLNRKFGIDWVDMMPVDSIRDHGKLVFMECDIRTYLTTGIQEARPNDYPSGIYSSSLWAGPPTPNLSRMALRKSFAHQITKASAIWWFDMWGGWFNDPILMEELTEMKKIYDADIFADKTNAIAPEIVFFADEQSHANILAGSPELKAFKSTRVAMGNTGVPYDLCMAEDAEQILKSYKAAIFPFYIPSDIGKRAIELCEKMGIPYLCATEEHYELTVDEIRDFYKKNGIHFYTEEKDVIYVGNGYIGLHSAIGGKKTIKFPLLCDVKAIFGVEHFTQTHNSIEFELQENDTALFAIML